MREIWTILIVAVLVMLVLDIAVDLLQCRRAC